jgi:hypothetical protein
MSIIRSVDNREGSLHGFEREHTSPHGRTVKRSLKLRWVSAAASVVILVPTLVEAYFQSIGFYEEHYVWPKEKFGVLTPPRWQDVAFLAVFWPLAIGLGYLAYRLLNYALGRETALDR